MAPRLVLATRNAHKVVELRRDPRAASPAWARPRDRGRRRGDVGAPGAVEDGVTFAANALLKARAVAAATGLPAVADDSGLCVDVLGGMPGHLLGALVGRHGDDRANLELLLAQLADVPDEHRGARLRLRRGAGAPGRRRARRDGPRCVGTLPRAARRQRVRLRPDLRARRRDRARCAELTAAEKNAISHRGQAFRALVPVIVRALGR